MQLGTDDITTTWTPFNYFLNTRAKNSLCYGPGVLSGALAGEPVEFIIQARNEQDENRTSGRDTFAVRCVRKVEIKVEKTKPVDEEGNPLPDAPAEEEEEVAKVRYEEIEIPTTVVDNADGTYLVTYTPDVVGDYFVYVEFLNDKEQMVPLRGVYKASFVDDAKPTDNTMTGGVMDRYIKKEMERLTSSLSETKKEVNPKDKELKNVKVLLKVKENVESTQKNVDGITL